MNPPGKFVVSLDFELFWGVRDKRDLNSYAEEMLGAREVVPSLLRLFQRYGIHATWATVGFLFFDGRDELKPNLPKVRPGYNRRKLDPYPHVEETGRTEEEDPYHFAPSLIQQILDASNQELASHTFSHYYCLEEGQNIAAFEADLEAARRAAHRFGAEVESLVLPRNQADPRYLEVASDAGFACFRGNEDTWLHRPVSDARKGLLRRGLRWADAYVDLTGHHVAHADAGSPVNVPSSRFLRPVTPWTRPFQQLHRRRIVDSMERAAESGGIFHLWWHPHNFGGRPDENLRFLGSVLEHFQELQEKGMMESLSMEEVAREREKGGGVETDEQVR